MKHFVLFCAISVLVSCGGETADTGQIEGITTPSKVSVVTANQEWGL